MPGSLIFGAATSDVVDVGSGASLDDLDPFTVLLWCMPTTLTSGRALWSKMGTGNKFLRFSDAAGNVQLFVTRAVTTSYITNTAPLGTTNQWALLAASFSSAQVAGQIVKIYKGALGVPAAAQTFGTATDGSGALTTDNTGNGRWSNMSSLAVSFQGRIAMGAVFGAELSLADVQSWQQRPRVTVGANAAKAFFRLGNEGVGTQQDYSGNANTGTVTGATQGDGPGFQQAAPGSLFLRAA